MIGPSCSGVPGARDKNDRNVASSRGCVALDVTLASFSLPFDGRCRDCRQDEKRMVCVVSSMCARCSPIRYPFAKLCFLAVDWSSFFPYSLLHGCFPFASEGVMFRGNILSARITCQLVLEITCVEGTRLEKGDNKRSTVRIVGI